MKEESSIDRIIREDYGVDDVVNAEYPSSERLRNDPNAIVAIPRLWLYGMFSKGDKPTTKREYNSKLDKLLNFNFGKDKGLKKIINYFKFSL